MNKDPLVTIGIPCYQAEKYVYGAINSAVVQTYKNIEIIVVDDGSTDETKNICKSFGDKIRYLKNEKNMGIGYGRWKIVEESQGDYIVFCSADDILSNQFVEEMLKEAEKNPDKILYCGSFEINQFDNVTRQHTPKGFDDHDDFCVSCYEAATRNTMFVNFSCIMIPRTVFNKVNFDPNIRYGEDLDFLLRSMKHFQYKDVPLTLVKYRMHEGMVTVKKWNSIEENNKKIIENWMKYWRDAK